MDIGLATLGISSNLSSVGWLFDQVVEESREDLEARWAAEDAEEDSMQLATIEYKEESFAERGPAVERLADEFFFSRKSLAEVGASDEAMTALQTLGTTLTHSRPCSVYGYLITTHMFPFMYRLLHPGFDRPSKIQKIIFPEVSGDVAVPFLGIFCY